MLNAEVMQNNVITVGDNAISDSVKFETISFNFPKSWEGFKKTAVFISDSGETLNIVLDSENENCVSETECYIPSEVLKAPGFEISVFGICDEKIATATKAFVKVLSSGYISGGEPTAPTPTEYQQLINITESTKQMAQAVKTAYDNGELKGEKGDIGPQGLQGPQGEKGENGKDAVTDQSYNPRSKNAQSGKAVAEAIAGIAIGGDSSVTNGLAPLLQRKLELWQPNTEYKVGDVVIAKLFMHFDYVTNILVCRKAHTSSDAVREDTTAMSEYWEFNPIVSDLSMTAVADYFGNPISDTYATKDEVATKSQLDDIETALDNILNIENSFIGLPVAEEAAF